MDFSEYLAAISRESDALAAAAQRGLEPAVPSCPGWTVRDEGYPEWATPTRPTSKRAETPAEQGVRLVAPTGFEPALPA